ncbi:MAG: Hsp70 family protein [Cyanobacteria bacterium MAG CAR4_bin_6]|nr:Hsp70 family protein [Cyanobacteria bacterium MAG CAR4_bin_6]MCY4235508.1 Hsp70 family protein [Cyanobacteria bacterium MAG CAR2_bin_4]MCY4331517.1 Hsp70 family protein [Cyanobacteria bacterium MAG CAR1_bin_15]
MDAADAQGGSLAIDLGSSNTVVAHQPAGGGPPRLLNVPAYSHGDEPIVPTLLYCADDCATAHLKSPRQPCLVGRQVIEAGFLETVNQPPQPPAALYCQFKRSIGARPRSRQVERAERGGAMFLEHLWRALQWQTPPERLVLTAPVDAFAGYRRWLLDQGGRLPVPELALVDEPTAAAIGSGLPPGSHVLVVDLGAGTSDLALVQIQGGEGQARPISQLLRFNGNDLGQSSQRLRVARVVGKAGAAVGGRDLDQWIAAHMAPWAKGPLPEAWIHAAEQLKCQLSADDQATVNVVRAEGGVTPWQLKRSALESLLQRQGFIRLLDRLLEQVASGARREGLDLSSLTAVLPVGGTSCLPLVRRWLEQRLPGVPCCTRQPLTAVAYGALALTPNVQVRDVLSRGVALRYWDRRQQAYCWHPLYWAGQPWPTESPLQIRLAPAHANQPALELVLAEIGADLRREVVFVDGQPQLLEEQAPAASMTPWPAAFPPLPLPEQAQPGQDALLLAFSITDDRRLHLEVKGLLHEKFGPELEYPLDLGPLR